MKKFLALLLADAGAADHPKKLLMTALMQLQYHMMISMITANQKMELTRLQW